MQGIFRGFMQFPYGILSAPVSYGAPTLSQMRDWVAQDLRDPELKTFNMDEVTDLVRKAIIEVGGVYPKEAVDTLTLAADTWRYTLLVEDPFRVEIVDGTGVYQLHQSDGEASSNGWEFFGGVLSLPRSTHWTVTTDQTTTPVLRVWGYARRFPPTEEADLCDVDAVAERAVRLCAVFRGYQRLVNDRTLFSQWNSESQNTDVTMTQLMGVAQVFGQDWDQERRRIRLLRRI